MIDLTDTLIRAQVAFAFGLIAIAIFYYVFYKKPPIRSKK